MHDENSKSGFNRSQSSFRDNKSIFGLKAPKILINSDSQSEIGSPGNFFPNSTSNISKGDQHFLSSITNLDSGTSLPGV
jgi:hypothetical protein